MAEEKKKTLEDFRAFLGGIPCADMMRKMMEGKREGQSFDCTEMMSMIMDLDHKVMGKKDDPVGKNKHAPSTGQ